MASQSITPAAPPKHTTTTSTTATTTTTTTKKMPRCLSSMTSYRMGAAVFVVVVVMSLVTTLFLYHPPAPHTFPRRSSRRAIRPHSHHHRHHHHHHNYNLSCYHSDTAAANDSDSTSSSTSTSTTTKNQCFLFPKLSLDDDTTGTRSATSTTSSTHRQLDDYLGQNPYRIPPMPMGFVCLVRVANTNSRWRFHGNPDGADIFVLNNGTQYVYLSNAEHILPWTGGVYGIVLDAVTHVPLDYRPYLRRTTRNCNGGRTPWNTWVSCEEAFLPFRGHCWQVDPTGTRRPQRLTMSGWVGGSFEAFAYDDRNTSSAPSFYITEDASDGTMRRYRPPVDTPMGWDMLHLPRNVGTLDYLLLDPETNTFSWTTNMATGRSSARGVYPNSEGIAIHNGTLAFVSKVEKLLFLINLDQGTYTAVSTETTAPLSTGGTFDAQPDHVISYPATATATNSERDGNLLFLTEDGGGTPGLFAYDGAEYWSVLEAAVGAYDGDEVTGLAFSPDGTKMYACLQSAGVCFQISRVDAEPFRHRRTLKWRKGLKL